MQPVYLAAVSGIPRGVEEMGRGSVGVQSLWVSGRVPGLLSPVPGDADGSPGVA